MDSILIAEKITRASRLPIACAMPWARAGLMVYLAMYLSEKLQNAPVYVEWITFKLCKEIPLSLLDLWIEKDFRKGCMVVYHINSHKNHKKSKISSGASWCECCHYQRLLAKALAATSSWLRLECGCALQFCPSQWLQSILCLIWDV